MFFEAEDGSRDQCLIGGIEEVNKRQDIHRRGSAGRSRQRSRHTQKRGRREEQPEKWAYTVEVPPSEAAYELGKYRRGRPRVTTQEIKISKTPINNSTL